MSNIINKSKVKQHRTSRRRRSESRKSRQAVKSGKDTMPRKGKGSTAQNEGEGLSLPVSSIHGFVFCKRSACKSLKRFRQKATRKEFGRRE
jgi:hypothetical protein